MEPGSMQSSNRKSPEINLAELGLSERIGKGLEKLQHLMVLSLSHNNFNGCITHPLTLFSTIQNLNLSHNGFSGQIPASFLNMSSIRSLDLSHNSFSGHIPQSFFDSYNFLHYFSLSNNMFEGQIPSRISRCSSLNSIDLSNNRFAGYIDFVVGRTTTPSNGSSDGGSSNTRATPGEQNGGSNDAAAPNGKQRQRTTSAAVKGSGDGDGSEAGRHGHTNRSPPFADLSLSPQASLTLNLASGCPGSSTTAIAHSGVVPCSGSPSSRHWSRPPPSELHGLSLSSGFLLRDGNGGNGTGSSRAAIRRQLHKSTATRLGRSSSVVTALLAVTTTTWLHGMASPPPRDGDKRRAARRRRRSPPALARLSSFPSVSAEAASIGVCVVCLLKEGKRKSPYLDSSKPYLNLANGTLSLNPKSTATAILSSKPFSQQPQQLKSDVWQSELKPIILTKRASRNEHAYHNKGRTTTPSSGSFDGGSSNTRATPGELNGGSSDAAAPNGKQRRQTTSAVVKGSRDGDGFEAGRHDRTNRNPPSADLSLSSRFSLFESCRWLPWELDDGDSTRRYGSVQWVALLASLAASSSLRVTQSLSLSSGFLLRDGNGSNGTGSSHAAIRRRLHGSTATRLGRSSSVVTALLAVTMATRLHGMATPPPRDGDERRAARW
ncbi:hypothetical protein Ahy_B03g063586 [Arachis hypogaea]|uniref:Uncharacterized protein n=1 Tax=Arachis hypogaea TaxID=3818 RepID=A0A444ZXK6_ARAHY|nr:hypothetical protein Ahy_B03g063586 [Arachis hypogaea]